MRILAAADIHGRSEIAIKLAERAEKEKVELVVLCGDLTGFVETKNIIAPFKERNQRVLIIPGNHESIATTDFLAKRYGIDNLHGYSIKFEDIGIFGAGGGEPGPGRISDEEMFETLKKANSGLEGIEKKIMITHEHPSGSKSEASGFPGSEPIAKAIKEFKPSILLHGHIHECEGIEEMIGNTKVINVGKNGRIIEI